MPTLYIGAFAKIRFISLPPFTTTILMKFGDSEVNVVVNGVNLSEYGEETQVINGIANVSCWIPSEAGQVSLLGVCIR